MVERGRENLLTLNFILNTKSLLIIFTRNPDLGKVKTRLAKGVGDKAALEIYKFLLRFTHSITKNLPVDKEVYYSDIIPENDIWEEGNFSKKLQQGKDLGARMQQAFQSGFDKGYEKIIIIGSDMYDLNSQDLNTAFSKLIMYDFVVGPAEDGGYYLLGLAKFKSELFQQKTWGSSTVLEDTLADLKDEKFLLLEERNDIDYFEDIKDHKDFQQFFTT